MDPKALHTGHLEFFTFSMQHLHSILGIGHTSMAFYWMFDTLGPVSLMERLLTLQTFLMQHFYFIFYFELM
jgi:hypothetical protein